MKTPRTLRFVTLAGLVLAVALGGCGGDDGGPSGEIRANETDMAFATDMLDHHERGIDAADLAPRRAESRAVRTAASDLIQLQSPEAQVLRAVRRTLADGGIEEGDLGVPRSSLDPAELRTADDFDAAYTREMIAHHEAAIAMAAVERERGVHAELRRMAGDITDLARFQIRQLERGREAGS
jgi:uncharacterized protein (DUF305 family)